MVLINKHLLLKGQIKIIMENTHKLYESPQRDRNIEKYGDNSDRCICCGKPMKDDECLLVHMNTAWLAVRNDITENDCVELTGAESQGCFPIGNSCAKKMPSKFIIKPISNTTNTKASIKNDNGFVLVLPSIGNVSLLFLEWLAMFNASEYHIYSVIRNCNSNCIEIRLSTTNKQIYNSAVQYINDNI